MKKNMGTLDKAVRSIAAILLVVLYFTGAVSGTVGYVFLGIAAVFLLTSTFSFCPLYAPFGMSTCKVKTSES